MGTETPPDRGLGGTMWYKALSHDELPEGRVKGISCGETTVAATHYDHCVETFPAEERDGEIYVGLLSEGEHEHIVSDEIAEMLSNWNIRRILRVVSHSYTDQSTPARWSV